MAYIGNQLAQITTGPLSLYGSSEMQISIWAYANTVDPLATVLGANYISDGQKRGLTLGSLVLFFDGVNTNILQVSALQTPTPGPNQNPASANFGVTLSAAGASPFTTGVAAKYVTGALQSAAIPVASVTGADHVIYDNTGVTPGNLSLPTAAAIVAALPDAAAGFSYRLTVKNSSSGANTLTLTTATGLTLTGTMTAVQNAARELVVTITNNIVGSEAVTVQSYGTWTGAD